MHEQTRPSRPDAATGAPDVLPVLARGRHRSPRAGACFMEMASFLAGERWSDHPACTHPLLARLAREVNDRTDDDARPRLGLLVPSVVGLHDDDPATDARLALLCAQRALPVAAEERQRALAVALLVGEDVLDDLEGRPTGSMSCATTTALEQVPLATRWARSFVAGTRTGRDRRATTAARLRDYRRHGAPSAVTTAVRGIAGSYGCRPADDVLHDLLADAVALVAGPTRRPTWTPPERWEEACRLTAAGRR